MDRTRRKRNMMIAILVSVAAIIAIQWAGYRSLLPSLRDKALLGAILHNNARRVQELLKQGANPNVQLPTGRPPSLWQLFLNSFEPHSRPISHRPAYGPTALVFALSLKISEIQSNRPENVALIQALLDHGADVHARDIVGDTVLDLAVESGYYATAKLLLDRGADVNAATEDGDTALIYACDNQPYDLMKLLLDRGANVNAKDTLGRTVLIWACLDRAESSEVKLLLDHGADVNAKDFGSTALMIAAQQGRDDVVRLLLQRGAAVNAQNHLGHTALMLAAYKRRQTTVQILLDHGADVQIKDKHGKTAMDWATAHREIIRLLKQASARR